MTQRDLEGLLVGDLEPARRAGELVYVRPEAPMKRAMTEMVSYGFSQLPVVRTERDVPGVVTWRSLTRVWMVDDYDREVKEFMVPAIFASVNDPVLELIDKVIAHECVLVSDEANKLCGLVTAHDLSKEFHKIGEPFLLVGSIERGLRQIIRPHFEDGALLLILDKKRGTSVDDLVFGDLHALLSSEVVWHKLGLPLEQASFNKKLSEVIEWRNKLVHSRICYLEDAQLRLVRNFEKLVRDIVSGASDNARSDGGKVLQHGERLL